MTTTIFESDNGKVWKSGNDYATLNSGHLFVTDVAKEIERLQARIAELEAEISERDARDYDNAMEYKSRKES